MRSRARGLKNQVHTSLLAGLLIAACGQSPVRDLRPCPSVDFELCNLLEPECQASVYRHSECARDFEGGGMPPVQTITRADYRAQLTSAQAQSPSEKKQREDKMVTTGFQLLGLLDPKLASQQQSDIDLQVTSTLAYYSITDKVVTLIDHQKEQSLAKQRQNQLVLAHEFTHAQQDEAHDLERFFKDKFDGSTDGYYAWRSLLEAEANLSEDLVAILGQSTKPSETALRAKLLAIRARQEVFAQASKYPYTLSLRNFPYSTAYAFVAEHYLEEGLSGIAELYATPRTSMLDFMQAPGQAPVQRRSLSWTTPQSVKSSGMLDRMGAWVFYTALLRQGIESTKAKGLALAWRGDALALHANEAGQEVAIMWRIALEKVDTQALEGLASQLQGATAPGARALFVHEDELVWVLTQNPSQLQHWLAEAKGQLESANYRATQPLAPLPRRLIEGPRPWSDHLGCRHRAPTPG